MLVLVLNVSFGKKFNDIQANLAKLVVARTNYFYPYHAYGIKKI